MKIIKFLINIFLSLILIITISASMFLYCSKALISKENISEYVKNADILNNDIGTLFNREPIDVSLKEKITELAIQSSIPEEIVEDILRSEEINKLLGDFFSQTIMYIIKGNNKPVMLQKTVDDMKFIARESLNNHINVMLEEDQLDIYVEEYCKSIATLAPERNSAIGNLPIATIGKVVTFNPWYLYTLSFLIVLLLIINNKAIYKAIKYLGIAMLISGIMYIILGSLDYLISNYVLNQMSAIKPFVSSIVTSFLTICFKNGVLISFTSIILLLCFITINAIAKD